MGLLASTSMGRLSDGLGRRVVLLGLAATSAVCSLVFGWLIGLPLAVVFAVGALYGFAALGDSPVLSTALTEAVDPPHLGAALALRSFMGFGAGAIAPIVCGRVLDVTNPPGASPTAWGWAFVTLGAGGLAAAWCARGLAPDRVRTTRPAPM
jgi:MFS family permease